MNYNQAIELLKKSPYNLQLDEVKNLADLRLLRFIRRFHKGSGGFAIAAYGPKSLKDDIYIWLDCIVNISEQFGFDDIEFDI